MKHKDPLGTARTCLHTGKYTVTYHANGRQVERVVPLPDVINALDVGRNLHILEG